MVTLNYFSCSEKSKSGAGKMVLDTCVCCQTWWYEFQDSYHRRESTLSPHAQCYVPWQKDMQKKRVKTQSKTNKQTTKLISSFVPFPSEEYCLLFDIIEVRYLHKSKNTSVQRITCLNKKEYHTILLNASFISLVVHWVSENWMLQPNIELIQIRLLFTL